MTAPGPFEIGIECVVLNEGECNPLIVNKLKSLSELSEIKWVDKCVYNNQEFLDVQR